MERVSGVSETATRKELAQTASTQFEFCGKHLIASYSGCRLERLEDKGGVDSVMRLAVEASGATVVDAALHVFPGAGMTCVYVLAESHASIHTYPEHSSCFVDIFTCGYECDPLKFDAVLTQYFQPERVSRQLILRGGESSSSFAENKASIAADCARAGVVFSFEQERSGLPDLPKFD